MNRRGNGISAVCTHAIRWQIVPPCQSLVTPQGNYNVALRGHVKPAWHCCFSFLLFQAIPAPHHVDTVVYSVFSKRIRPANPSESPTRSAHAARMGPRIPNVLVGHAHKFSIQAGSSGDEANSRSHELPKNKIATNGDGEFLTRKSLRILASPMSVPLLPRAGGRKGAVVSDSESLP